MKNTTFYDIDKCKLWLSNPNINPITNKKIAIGGPTFEKIRLECEDLLQEKIFPEIEPLKFQKKVKSPERKKIININNITEDYCQKWFANPNINPITMRKISYGSSTYNKLNKNCSKYGEVDKYLINPELNYLNKRLLKNKI